MTGVEPRELAEAPPLPPLTALVWGYFVELSAARGSNGFGANSITPTGIRDWCWLTGVALDPWEIQAIARLDEAYLRKEDD